MTQLGDQLAEIGKELEVLLAGDDNRRIIDQVGRATEELSKKHDLLSSALAHRCALCGSPVNASTEQLSQEEKPVYDHLQASYGSLKQVWQEDPSSVRQKGVVGDFCESVESYAKIAERNSLKSWDAWKESLERQFAIAGAQLESVKSVLNYAGPIAKYREGVNKFASLSRRVPDDRGVLQEMKVVADSLKKIKEGFTFDLPREVINFFNALDRDGEFPLSKLGQEISHWLAENDGLKDLSIVRGRMTRQ